MKYCVLLLVLLAGCATQRGFPPKDQIINFDYVNKELYRGGQPNSQALHRLLEMRVASVINLRMANDTWQGEAELLGLMGIQYTNIPLHGLSAPSKGEMESILQTIKTMPKPVYVHCKYGCDRTGMVVACYRIRREKMPADVALKEAEFYGMSPLECGMKAFIKRFK